MKLKPVIVVGVVVAIGVVFYMMTAGTATQVCEVCMDFGGRHNCATAAAQTAQEATTTAHRTACGPLANGMDETIACENRPPARVQCKT